jgi:Na+/melibiose symporter-like transporter
VFTFIDGWLACLSVGVDFRSAAYHGFTDTRHKAQTFVWGSESVCVASVLTYMIQESPVVSLLTFSHPDTKV